MSESVESVNLDSKRLRQVLGSFVTGVTVVTTIDSKLQARGMTANSFTSVSLDPPLVLVCIADSAHSYSIFESSQSFAINILCEEQLNVSNLFASKSPEKFSKVDWHKEKTGSPILDDSLGWIDCRVSQKFKAGDHLILLGQVESFDCQSGMPLGYFKGGYVDFSSQSTVPAQYDEKIVIGSIVEISDEILLVKSDDNKSWIIPNSECFSDAKNARAAVKKYCQKFGVEINLTFVYSIFTLDNGSNYIVYRTSVNNCIPNKIPDQGHWFKFSEIPWSEITIRQIATMLKRYINERSVDRFGIYVDSDHGGQVAVLNGEPELFEHYRPN